MSETVLITRPKTAAQAFAKALPQEFAPLLSPLTGIEPNYRQVPPADKVASVIFTSAQGVKLLPPKWGQGLTAWCVGPATAEAARRAGFEVRVGPGTAAELVPLLVQDGQAPFLHVRGSEVATQLVTPLRAAGLQADEHVLYSTPQVPLSAEADQALASGSVDIVTIFSTRAAHLLAEEDSSTWDLRRTRLISLSEGAAAPLAHLKFQSVHVSAAPNQNSVIETMRQTVAVL